MRFFDRIMMVAAALLTAVFLFGGCGMGGGQTNPDAAEDSGVSGKTDVYDDVLAQYRDMVRNHFYKDLIDSDAYEDSFGKDIGVEIRGREQDIYYAFYDIDGNGMPELLIAGGEDAGSESGFTPWYYDLYAFDGTKAVHIFPDMEFGYRTNVSLCENGLIKVTYSASAVESGVDFYRISDDGFTPEQIEAFSAVGRMEGDRTIMSYYDKNKNKITKQEFDDGIQKNGTPLSATLEWVQIKP